MGTGVPTSELAYCQRIRALLASRFPWSELLLFSLTAILFAVHRTEYQIDDAYITYRYAHNAAHGIGARYMEGDDACGYSTPGFFLLLTAAEALGIPSHVASPWIAAFAQCLAAVVLYRLFRQCSGPWAAGLAVLCVVVHSGWLWTGQNGMETSLFVLCVLSTVLRATSASKHGVGAFLGATVLLRFDGIVLAPALMFCSLNTGQKLREGVIAALIVSAWLVFSFSYYGDFLPTSVRAKLDYHDGRLIDCLMPFVLAIVCVPTLQSVLFGLIVIGIGVAVVRRDRWILCLLAFVVLQIAGFTLSRIHPFNWYVVPPTVTATAIAGRGLAFVLESSRPKLLRWAITVSYLVFIGMLLVSSRSFLQDHGRSTAYRNRPYEQVTTWIRSNLEPGSTILVGEVGYMGYLLLDYRVIDSSGINCRWIQRLRRQLMSELKPSNKHERENLEYCLLRDVIDVLRPDAFTGFVMMSGYASLYHDAGFKKRYEIVHGPWEDLRQSRATMMAVRR